MRLVLFFPLLVSLFASTSTFGQANLPIYTDRLVNMFQDYSWAPHNSANTSPVHSGSDSISVTVNGSWQAISFYHPNFNVSPYASLSFWAHGGTSGGQKLQVYISYGASGAGPDVALAALTAGTWTQFTISLSSLGVANRTDVNRLNIQLTTSGTTGTFYIDDIQINAAPAPALVHLNVNASQTLRTADSRWFGVNTAMWDSYFDSTATINGLTELGTKILRCPGGSASDEYNWSTDKSLTNTWAWTTSFASFVHVATNVGVQAMITVNYGTGSSNQAAAWVAYANGSSTNTLSLGTDQYGTNWQTVGYWASLRAAAPLGSDDGRNFLRISRQAPFGFKFWEIGNECYGTWETDSNSVPHDPYTYATRAARYIALMTAVDSTIKIGAVSVPGEDSSINNSNHAVVNPRTGLTHYGWTPVMLTYLKSNNVTPDFLIHHVYPQWAGPESDALLLQSAVNWASDAPDLRQQLQDYLGPQNTNVELICTENNNQTSPLGRQSTSIVDALYLADSVSQLMKTEFNGYFWWDLRNGADSSGSFDPTIYGWRTSGDEGLLVNTSTRYPMFYTDKLMQYFVQAGDTVLNPTSDYLLLSAYGVQRSDGLLNLLVMNKDVTTSFTAQINLANYAPGGTAMVRSYGILQDEATRTNNPIPGSQDISTNFLAVSSTFTNTVPPGTVSLITFFPSQPVLTGISLGTGTAQIRFAGPYGQNYRVLATRDATLPMDQWTAVSSDVFGASGVTFTDSMQPQAQFYRIVSP